jgi:hypothetical protein
LYFFDRALLTEARIAGIEFESGKNGAVIMGSHLHWYIDDFIICFTEKWVVLFSKFILIFELIFIRINILDVEISFIIVSFS